ncbi:MAG TPA: iron-containing redox enzyme family protein [Streptosporangiaceae bacterium]|nr:iron-containing redox enzyme family protein [Streptosporangiaceae bacterium]
MLDRKSFEALAERAMERQFEAVPRMRDLHEGKWIGRDYYVRHLVETVLRIRLNNEVDTYALFKVGSRDDTLAAGLAKYLAEEFGHEGMFRRDLKRFGLSLEELNSIDVFPATAKLMGYLRICVDREGPAPTTVWNWFVEWYSDRYNQIITSKAAETFGASNVQGSQAHIDFDSAHDHDELMWRVVSRAVEGWSSAEKVLGHLDLFIDMVGDYFRELYEATAARTDAVAVSPGGAQA